VKILGVDLTRDPPEGREAQHTIVLLADDGSLVRDRVVSSLPAVAAAVGDLTADEPFLLGVNLPVVVPPKAARARPLENLVRRRFGYRLKPGGRGATGADALGIPGEALMAGLATAGLPCLPYPDRDRRQNGLAEVHPGLVLKALLWETGGISGTRDQQERSALFRAYAAPAYRAASLSTRATWAEQLVGLEFLLRILGSPAGYDLGPVRERLPRVATTLETEQAASLLDAILIASTARRYLQAPESCLFLGDQEGGYCILPADGFIRRLGSVETPPRHGELFPQASLRDLLGGDARLRSVDLLSVPGRPQRLEAAFDNRPRYEFDNLDEMLWWKHCRHLSGPQLPTEGLCELVVLVDGSDSGPASTGTALRLVRSRHRTLSFRFDPPSAWRSHVPTRDGKTYPLQVVRAVYETLSTDDS